LHHIMFDIDGTLVNSYDLDSACFIEAVKDVTGIQINSDWSQYHHVTDSGILKELLSSRQIDPTHKIETDVKQLFLEKLDKSIARQPIREISGASAFISLLRAKKNIVISIATGAWHESAVLKLKSAGIDFGSIPLASASDHVSRIEIMKLAALQATGGRVLPCTYFGDGSWDKKACEELGYHFVMVGNRLKHQPSILNFDSCAEVLACIGL
jgi:beta-phosphoglucomutase-like phosphatase (HAD superfamily)